MVRISGEVVVATVSQLKDYMAEVERILEEWGLQRATNGPWYRGQASENWSLIPGLYRGSIVSAREREICRDFKLSAARHLRHIPDNDIDWLFTMQHYGLPTRLLDWTESSLAALHFAVATELPNDEDAAVWTLDPTSLNEVALGVRSVPTSQSLDLGKHILSHAPEARVEAVFPCAVRPLRENERIDAQKGCFTLHGHWKDGLELIAEQLNSTKKCRKIRMTTIAINGSAKRGILRQLHSNGISHYSLFPDLEGLSRDISLKYSRLFLGDIAGNGMVPVGYRRFDYYMMIPTKMKAGRKRNMPVLLNSSCQILLNDKTLAWLMQKSLNAPKVATAGGRLKSPPQRLSRPRILSCPQ